MKKAELRKAAAEAAAHAADTGQEVWNEGLERAGEIIAEAQKLAESIIEEAQRRAIPAAREAGTRAATFAARQLDTWEPHIKDALDKVPPAIEAATDLVSDDLLPRLQQMLHDAADHPAVAEAARRGEAAIQALKGELEPVQPEPVKPAKKCPRFRKFVKVLAIGAAVAGAVAALRHFLAPKDDGWTAHEPSRAYVNNNDTFATAAKLREEPAPAAEEAPATDDEPTMTVETEAAPETAVNEEPAKAAAPNYGEGSYVGDTPPEGFVIKGNERSKKYHVQGTGGYERTIPEVWFNSEEAAQAAGFTKAQR